MSDPMSSVIDLSPPLVDAGSWARACRLIEDEGSAADEGRWDDWLACFAEDCVYWVPSWRADGRLADDHRTQVSHIYYDNKQALRDRVARFTSRASPASNPAPRTLHTFGSFRHRESSTPGYLLTRCSWTTHIFQPYSRETFTIFGTVDHDFVIEGDATRIARKKVVYMNDYIPSMLDIYMF